MSRARQRRARRRVAIQLIRKAIRRGFCPCADFRIADPGPHIPTCPWTDPDFDGDFDARFDALLDEGGF
jgi:hypothetical protein